MYTDYNKERYHTNLDVFINTCTLIIIRKGSHQFRCLHKHMYTDYNKERYHTNLDAFINTCTLIIIRKGTTPI